jgi:hypothetical protein
MSDDLKRFMVKLASEPDALADFMRDPRGAMDHAGLPPEEQEIVLSGDQGRIYATIKGMPLPPASPAPSPLQLPTVVSTMLEQPQGQPAAAAAAPHFMKVAAHAPAEQPAYYAAPAGQPVYYAAPHGQPIYYIVGWPYWPQR